MINNLKQYSTPQNTPFSLSIPNPSTSTLPWILLSMVVLKSLILIYYTGYLISVQLFFNVCGELLILIGWKGIVFILQFDSVWIFFFGIVIWMLMFGLSFFRVSRDAFDGPEFWGCPQLVPFTPNSSLAMLISMLSLIYFIFLIIWNYRAIWVENWHISQYLILSSLFHYVLAIKSPYFAVIMATIISKFSLKQVSCIMFFYDVHTPLRNCHTKYPTSSTPLKSEHQTIPFMPEISTQPLNRPWPLIEPGAFKIICPTLN